MLESYWKFIEGLTKGTQLLNSYTDEESEENMSKRVYRVERIYENSIYRFPRKLRDMGEYMKETSHSDAVGSLLYIGDVVRVNFREQSAYDYNYSIIVADKNSDNVFVMGYAATPISDMRLTKVWETDMIVEVYKERDFIIGCDKLSKMLNEALGMLTSYAEQLNKELEETFRKETIDSIEPIETNSNALENFENMKVSDILNLIENTTNEKLREEAKAFLRKFSRI